MAEVRIALGGVFDAATAGEVQQSVDRGVDRILSRIPSKDRAVRRYPSNSVNPGANGTYFIDLYSPPAGKIWWINEVVVTGNDDRTAVAGTTAALYRGEIPIPGASPVLGNLIRPAIAVPGVFVFSGEKYPIQDGDHLFVAVYLGAAQVSLSATAQVAELDSSAVMVDRVG
jgi:hypothetical protein